MLAYVDFESASGLIVHRMFSISPAGVFTWRSRAVSTLQRTSQGVALWYHDNYWWRAHINQATGNVLVHRSTDGLSWSYQESLGFSVQIPAVAATSHGVNHVFLTR